MKLDCVLTSCNENELYLDFIPIFIKTWKKLYANVDIKIILIMNDIPDKFLNYKDNIIIFKPLDNISTAFISQYIRILYPAILNYKNGILITDIDMIPMNSRYYTDNIVSYDDNKFIYYRNVLFELNEIAICYNVAINRIWSEIFNILDINDIIKLLEKKYLEINYENIYAGKGWTTDQLDLFKYVMEWNKKTSNFIYLNDNKTGYCRLDRINIVFNNTTIDNIKKGQYSDYHMLRPYKQYKQINDFIYDILPQNIIYNSIYVDNRFTKHIENNIKYIIEAGARDGYDAIILSQIYPQSQIYTFECNPETISICEKNLMHYNNIKLIKNGLGDNYKISPFYSYMNDNPGASSFYKRIDFDNTQKCTGYVNIITLYDFLSDNEIPYVDILCMDVQGYELNILKGCKEYLKKIRYIIMEEPKEIINENYLPKNTYSKYIGAPTPIEIKNFMKENNFIELERIQENMIEDNVLYKNIKFMY